MTPERVINFIALIISVASFIVVYNKAVKNRVNKQDLDELKKHSDNRDCELADRIDKIDEKIDKTIQKTHDMITEIYQTMLKKQ